MPIILDGKLQYNTLNAMGKNEHFIMTLIETEHGIW